MARSQSLASVHISSNFIDTFDVYVDYGQGQPIAIVDDLTTRNDIERFLVDHNRSIQSMAIKVASVDVQPTLSIIDRSKSSNKMTNYSTVRKDSL
jgi:hypothetical protein